MPLLLELAIVSWAFPRQTATPWLPARWSWLGLLFLLGALRCNALGGALWQEMQGRSFPSWHGPKSWLAFIAGALLGPLVEEWIFRGVLWRLASGAVVQLRPATRALIATGFTAILFAAWHVPFAGYAFFGYNLAFAAFLGLARQRLGAVGPGVLVHALGNSFYLLTS